jgi:hypothetical protein
METSKLNGLKDQAEVKIENTFDGIKAIDTYWRYLTTNSKKINDFNGSGYVFADLLTFLDEKKGINLLTSRYDDVANTIFEKRQDTFFILTIDHKKNYLSQLAPENFTVAELIDFNSECSEDDDPELANEEIACINALKESLELLTDDTTVVLLSIV